MSIINFTLIIQAINFFIAYYLIKHFFLAPALAYIEAENKLQEALIETVQKHQLSLAQQEKELSHQWQNMRDYFAQHTPTVHSESPLTFKTPEISAVVPPFLNQEGMVDLAHQVAKRIKNVG